MACLLGLVVEATALLVEERVLLRWCVTDALGSVDTPFDPDLALVVRFRPIKCCFPIGQEGLWLHRLDLPIGQREAGAFRAFLLASLLE